MVGVTLSFLTLYTLILKSFQDQKDVALNCQFHDSAEMFFRGESVGTSKG